MDIMVFNLSFILFSTLIVWVFLANNFYLKIFFVKMNAKKNKKSYQGELSDSIFDQVYNGYSAPDYIRKSVLMSQDKYQLLSLYMASKSLIDLDVYNKNIKYELNDRYGFCASLFFDSKNYFIMFIRVASMFGSVLLLFKFLDEIFFSEVAVIENSDQFIIFSVIILLSLMPYNVFSKFRFFNKLCGVFVFFTSILVALYFIVYIQNYSGYFIFNKLFFSVFMVNLIILIGAYSYLGYEKLEYMVDFFKLLKINLERSSDVGH